MIPPWLNRKLEIPAEVTALVKSARVNKCWIYDKKKRVYYTAEEFAQSWNRIIDSEMESDRITQGFSIVNPFFAVKQRVEWVNKANAELQAIMEKLKEYESEWTKK